jgi:hypothetical protein
MSGSTPPPDTPKSAEPNKGQPSQQQPNDPILQEFGKELIELAATTRQKWQWKRLGIVPKVLKNKEMLKGNQHMGIFPGSFDTFDPMEEFNNWTGASDEKNGDQSMDRRPHNFYQMLEKAFVAALSAQLPKTRWTPGNADYEEDRETAKVASRVEEIIERANKAKSMLRQELMEFFTSGCYFKFTRYVVDPDRTGTHKETVVTMNKAEMLPARYQCFQCGVTTPEDALVAQKKLACPNCGSPLGPENYFENHLDEIPASEMKEDVPNGMVLWSIYGPMHVDADPDAPDLLNTGLLNVSEEVSLGWLRTTFPNYWDKFQDGQNSGTSTELLERQYRDMLTMPAGYQTTWFSYASAFKPTYNRTWIQPFLFAEMKDKVKAQKLQQQFPQGCMLSWVTDMPLFIRPAKLTDEWTWAGSEQKGFGLFPPPVGDPAVPIQERLNDCVNKIDEYMDRLACGILLANEQYIDSKAMNGKAMLPGVLNSVYTKKGAPPGDIQAMIYQVKGEIDALIFQYVATLKQDMELLVGTPPQTFGAGTQEGVETKGGQEQQLNTGMMKLGMHWDVIADEHAEAAENAIKCMAKNATDDLLNVIADESKEWRNEFVHLDQLKGTIHGERNTEQGFPATAAEVRQFWMDIMQNPENPFAQELLSIPENVDACIRSLAMPGLKAPKGAMMGKMLRIINRLINGAPIMQPDPVTGEPLQVPSIMPNKYLDDLPTLVQLIPRWSQDHWDQLESNQNAIDNLVAYFKMCVVYERELSAEVSMVGAPASPDQGNQPATAQA